MPPVTLRTSVTGADESTEYGEMPVDLDQSDSPRPGAAPVWTGEHSRGRREYRFVPTGAGGNSLRKRHKRVPAGGHAERTGNPKRGRAPRGGKLKF